VRVQGCAYGLETSSAKRLTVSRPSLRAVAIIVVVAAIASNSNTKRRAGCADGLQPSTLWHTWSHDESAERWLAPSVAELRRDHPMS